MDIVQDKLKVSISYTLKDNNGRIIEEVPEKHPFIYLHGFDNIIQGLEEALLNRHVDEKFTVKVPYEKGYGTYNKDLVLEVPKDELADIGELWLGLELEMFQEDDSQEFHIPEYPEQIYDAIEYPLEKETGIYTIKEIKKDTVVLDGNHPFCWHGSHF
jgi:FKBP-type peptidyl-prolyl cis-trans isomerase SlyD